MKVAVRCPCGQDFTAEQRVIDRGRGRYCSRPCMYTYRVRPKGQKYEVKVRNKAWFEPGRQAPTGPDNHRWKGDRVGYRELHRWVAKHRAKTGECEHCGVEAETQWANKSHEYQRDLADWLELCRKCHRSHDSGPAWGLATQKYGRRAVQEGC
jgi:hypothetical protein